MPPPSATLSMACSPAAEHETRAADTLKTMDVIWTAYRSAEEGRTLPCSPRSRSVDPGESGRLSPGHRALGYEAYGTSRPAPVAQLDRASVYGTEGYWFESSRVYQRNPLQAFCRRFLFSCAFPSS